MLPERNADDVFVVRLWSEASAEGDALRGRVEHVASGQSRYVANFGDLCDFIMRMRAVQRELQGKPAAD